MATRNTIDSDIYSNNSNNTASMETHPGPSTSTNFNNNLKPINQCNYYECTETYNNVENMENHIKYHEGGVKVPYTSYTPKIQMKCSHVGCDKKFDNWNSLFAHRTLHHVTEYICNEPGCYKSGKVQCECGKKKFKKGFNSKRHERIHLDICQGLSSSPITTPALRSTSSSTIRHVESEKSSNVEPKVSKLTFADNFNDNGQSEIAGVVGPKINPVASNYYYQPTNTTTTLTNSLPIISDPLFTQDIPFDFHIFK